MPLFPPGPARPHHRRSRPGLSAPGWLLLGLPMLAPAPPMAQAQEVWPTRPIKLVVPFPPGGSTDTIGRLLASELGASLGQPVLVENKAGANGGIGAEQVAKASADGHVLLLSGIGSNATNYGLYRQSAYQDASFKHIISRCWRPVRAYSP